VHCGAIIDDSNLCGRLFVLEQEKNEHVQAICLQLDTSRYNYLGMYE